MYPRELTCLHHLTLHLSSKSSCLPDFSSPEMVLLFDSGHILECLRYHFLPYLPQPISPSIPCLPTSQVFTNPGDISPVHHAVHARTRTTVASALMATYLSVSSISASSLPQPQNLRQSSGCQHLLPHSTPTTTLCYPVTQAFYFFTVLSAFLPQNL